MSVYNWTLVHISGFVSSLVPSNVLSEYNYFLFESLDKPLTIYNLPIKSDRKYSYLKEIVMEICNVSSFMEISNSEILIEICYDPKNQEVFCLRNIYKPTFAFDFKKKLYIR